jgi:hypothetical protein
LYVADRTASKLYIVDETSFTKMGEVSLPESPWNIAVAPDGEHLLILYGESGTVSVMDLGTMTEETSLSGLNLGLAGAVFSADGTKAYVAHYHAQQGGVSVIDVGIDVGDGVHVVPLDAGEVAEGVDFGNRALNTPPVAEAGGPYTIDEGHDAVLDASGSWDADQPAGTLRYEWDLDGDEVFGETGSEAIRGDELGMYPTFSVAGVDGPSSVTVTLRVTDNAGEFREDIAEITVNNVPPTVEAGNDQTADEGESVSLLAAFHDFGTLDTHTATIDWGDGIVEAGTVAEDSGSGTVSGSHVYADNGEYAVTVTVTDDEGDSGSDSLVVTVNNAAPTILSPGEEWRVIYETDFSEDPGWTTNNSSRFHWDPSDETYYANPINVDFDGHYTYTEVDYQGGDFRQQWDMMADHVDYATILHFDMFDSTNIGRGLGGQRVRAALHTEDRGRTTLLQWVKDTDHGHYYRTSPQWSPDTWYSFVIEYDALASTLDLHITVRDTGQPWASIHLENVEPLDAEMNRLGCTHYSPTGGHQVPGAQAWGKFDNVVFSVPDYVVQDGDGDTSEGHVEVTVTPVNAPPRMPCRDRRRFIQTPS